MFPRSWIGSVVGLGGMGGAIGGMLFAPAVGRWLGWSGGAYGPVFVICGTMYLFALLVIHVLVPNLDRARITGDQTA
jgi:ACS family hexuronate transporter-like MFS transporter